MGSPSSESLHDVMKSALFISYHSGQELRLLVTIGLLTTRKQESNPNNYHLNLLTNVLSAL